MLSLEVDELALALPNPAALPAQRHVIINPRARQGRSARLLPLLDAYLRQHWPEVQLHCCGTLGDLERAFAAMAPGSRVVGVGGDGTNHVLLPHLLHGGHQYAMVPQGSGNDLARSAGLQGLPWARALEIALHAAASAVDVGQVHCEDSGRSRYFLGCCLVGLDAHIANLTQPWKLSGPLPYLLTLLAQLPRLRGWRMAIDYWHPDAQHQHCAAQALLLCSVLNTPTYGSGLPIAPMARIDDGQIELLYVPMRSRLQVLGLLGKLLRGRHVGQPGVHLHAVRQLRLRASEPLPLSLDGEIYDWRSRQLRVELHRARLALVRAP